MKCIIIYLILVLLPTVTLCFANDADRFSKISEYGIVDYCKKEDSGCSTHLVWNENTNTIKIWHDRQCGVNPDKRESVLEIAKSVVDILRQYNLESKVRSIQSFGVNIGWDINHELLIRYINSDLEWPDDIVEFSASISTNEKESDEVYRAILKKEILESKIYEPFFELMLKYNCKLTLNSSIADGIQDINRDSLVKNGFFSEVKAKKKIYPEIKGVIEFDVSCN